MASILDIPIAFRLVACLFAGLFAAGFINWAIDAWAWSHRWGSPWRRVPEGETSRSWLDCVPILGWIRLRRETKQHGKSFWIRGLIVELVCGTGLALLYWWEVDQLGLVEAQIRFLFIAKIPIDPASLVSVVHATFLFHALLGGLMLIASLIDIDDLIIPDEVTVYGAILGLSLATLLPIGMLPHAYETVAPRVAATPVLNIRNQPVTGFAGGPIVVQPMHLAAGEYWPIGLAGFPRLKGLLVGLGCWWLWCFAFTSRRYRGSRGFWFAMKLITRRVVSDFLYAPRLRAVTVLGTLAVIGVWYSGGLPWFGLLNSLVGLVGCGATVWIIRILGSAALGKEAMGFGDVTLMMMIGTYLGWQAGVLIFFVAPFAALMLGVVRLALGGDNILPYGPFLCLGTAVVVVCWAKFWLATGIFFAAGWLVPVVLFVCLVACAAMLLVWSLINQLLFAAE